MTSLCRDVNVFHRSEVRERLKHPQTREYAVQRGLTIGHEPVGVIEKLGSEVRGYRQGQPVVAGAITLSGWGTACLSGVGSQDGAGTAQAAGRRWVAA